MAASWKEFETLISRLQAAIAPGADVRENEKVVGKSGRTRQLDVTIRQTLGLYPILVVIECKSQKRRISISQVEAFVTKLRDVAASEGVIVSRNGFSEGAKAIARDNFITCLGYREAEEADWDILFKDEAWLRMSFPKSEGVRASATLSSGRARELRHDDVVLDGAGSVLAAAADLSRDLLGSTQSLKPVGDFRVHFAFDTPVFLKIEGGPEPISRLTLEGKNRMFGFVINLKLAGGHILEDGHSDKKMHSEYFSEGFNWQKMIRSKPIREIGEEEWAEGVKADNFKSCRLKLNELKPWLRLVVTSEPRVPGGTEGG